MEHKKQKIRNEFEVTREEYHSLLKSFSENDLKRRSNNQGWTNKEVLFHILLGFIVVTLLFPMVKLFAKLPNTYSKIFASMLNASTPIFNFLNAFGARIGGKIFSVSALDKKFSQTIDNLLRKLETVKEEEWEKGMYFPHKWDGLFDEYMTNEKLFHYPVSHFKFHLKQIDK